MSVIDVLQVSLVILASETIGETSRGHVQHHCRKETPRRRIFAGRDDTRHPYVVAIVSVRKLFALNIFRGCSGSVISKEWVLTSAHCVAAKDFTKEPTEKAPRVLYGNLTVEPEKAQSWTKILKGIIFPRYQSRLLTANDASIQDIKHDIGLYLIEPVDFKIIGKISVIDYKTLIGHTVHYVGTGGEYPDSALLNVKEWISQFKKAQTSPRKIGKGTVIKCDKEFNRVMTKRGINPFVKFKKISRGRSDSLPAICLRSPCSNRQESAQLGDSGGPLIFRGKIVGVGSTVNSINAQRTPVSPYLDWIELTMSKH